MNAPCSPPVCFNFQEWGKMFPSLLSGVNPTQASELFFPLAESICANSTTNPIFGQGKLKLALYLLTAHIASLFAPIGGQPASGTVGRVDTATQGSVTVGLAW